MRFDVQKVRKEVNKIQKENEKNEKSKRGLSTLLQFIQGKKVKVALINGEAIEGTLTKYSLYEIEIKNEYGTFIIWKQAIKYLQIK